VPDPAAPPFLAACRRRPTARTPVWFMRQAGRSLPEYRAIRGDGSILDAIKVPDLSTEITLQPVRRYGVDEAAAEDLALLVVGNAVERIAQLRDPSKLGSWLCRAAINAAISAHRRENRTSEPVTVHPATLLGIAGPPPGMDEADTRAWRETQIRHVVDVVEALNTRYRDVWTWLAEGLTHAEIAVMMGITLNNAHQLKHRTLTAVRRELVRRGVPLKPPPRRPE